MLTRDRAIIYALSVALGLTAVLVIAVSAGQRAPAPQPACKPQAVRILIN